MVYLILVTARTVPKIWDPYDVLGVSRSASEKQIKSHYRRLSLTYHPDKAQVDPEKNVTLETINEHWVEMTKAFKALTDEEIRNNYIQFGHPDGKQSFSIGIALPKWLVEEGHGKYILMVYGVLLGILLPYFVGKWWYGQQKLTKEKVLVASAGHLVRAYQPELNDGDVVNALSSGEEYKQILKGNKADHGSSRLEQKILSEGELTPLAGGLQVKDRKKLEDMDEGARRKALGLLWAYLGRVELEDPVLNNEKYEVAPTALRLNDSFTVVALAFGNTEPVLAGYRTSQNLIQAVAPGVSPLSQLPHFSPKVIQAIEGANARTHKTVQYFMRMSDSRRRQLSVGPGLLTDEQYKTAVGVASQLPHLHVEKAFFKVVGERYITPSSLVQFVVKARIIPPGTVELSEVDPKDLEDPDPAEGDLDALHNRNKEAEGSSIQPPLTHAPFFARDHSPRWHLFLGDSKQGKIAVPPTTFTTFDKPLFDESGKPTFNVQTLRMQFGAPPQAGRYTFVMHLLCDSYVGMDTKMEVTLVVDEPSKAEEILDDGEISEPEEGESCYGDRHWNLADTRPDSIAGQMHALKGGKTKKRVVDDSDDESGTDSDENSSETDTDTDSDEE